jgi:hypothetical protein
LAYFFSIHFWFLITLKTIGFHTTTIPHHIDADPDPACHSDAVPDPDPSFQIKAQNLEEKCSKRLIFHTFWLVRMMRIRDPAYHVDADADADPDPTFQFDRPMRIRTHNTVQNSDLLQKLIFNQHKAKTARSMKQKMLGKQITKKCRRA